MSIYDKIRKLEEAADAAVKNGDVETVARMIQAIDRLIAKVEKPTEKLQMMYIEVDFSELDDSLVGSWAPREFQSLVDAMIRRETQDLDGRGEQWAGTYRKTDVKVTWAGGHTFSFRWDIRPRDRVFATALREALNSTAAIESDRLFQSAGPDLQVIWREKAARAARLLETAQVS